MCTILVLVQVLQGTAVEYLSCSSVLCAGRRVVVRVLIDTVHTVVVESRVLYTSGFGNIRVAGTLTFLTF